MAKSAVEYITIISDFATQRIDNFLINRLKGVPKTHIYKILRKGEVRVNKKRIKQTYRLQEGDEVRIPPMQLEDRNTPPAPSKQLVTFLSARILYQDDNIIIINKPAGISVHGGSGIKLGVVEALRTIHPKLELVHRLDRDTSGCLILAKKRSTLRELHTLLREGQVKKIYHTLTKGHWKQSALRVEASLLKNQLSSGERIVRVHDEGKPSVTIFTPLVRYKYSTLMEALLETGRTHQIRVHAQFRGHQVAGDEKYGDKEFNKQMHQLGLKRLFLHAYFIEFTLPSSGKHIQITAPLDDDLQACLKALE